MLTVKDLFLQLPGLVPGALPLLLLWTILLNCKSKEIPLSPNRIVTNKCIEFPVIVENTAQPLLLPLSKDRFPGIYKYHILSVVPLCRAWTLLDIDSFSQTDN